jgi:CDP-diacylglycerol--serine O-phosphatidyltransferase
MRIVDIKPKNENQGSGRIVALHRIIPNMMTLTAMAAGLTSIQFALHSEWEKAVLAILLAVVLDGMDGATARLLKATSDFGAQLDSLSDFLSFGVAPAIILYTWILNESGRLGWIAMIFYASATALRLARYNVEKKKLPKWHEGFFSGIPSPAGAGLALMPLILWFQYPDFFKQFAVASPLVGLWTIVVGSMMVSRVPTFSIKSINIPARMIMSVMAFAALMMAALVTVPWQTLTVVGIAYMISIPFAMLHFSNMKKGHHVSDLEDLPLLEDRDE